MRRSVIILVLVFVVLSGCAHRKITHYRDHPREYRVISTLQWIASKNDISLSEVKYLIWKTEEINAGMSIENVVMVTTGLLDALPLENHTYLAVVIAHELAHYKLGHVAKAHGVNVGTNAGISTIAFVIGMATGIPFLDLAGNAVASAITNTYSRSQEYEADIYSVGLLKNAGCQNPKQIVSETLAWFGKTIPQTNLWIWNSHPMPQDRIKNVLK